MIGALSYGHLPAVFVPAGPMPSGISNAEKARVRGLYAEGKATRDDLLKAEMEASYHAPGTCTFYGTANSNQMLMELMGVHLPGAAFVHPYTPLREALARAAAQRGGGAAHDRTNSYTPLGWVIDAQGHRQRSGRASLVATGGSTNHALHLVAIARTAEVADRLDRFRRPCRGPRPCWRGSIPTARAT